MASLYKVKSLKSPKESIPTEKGTKLFTDNGQNTLLTSVGPTSLQPPAVTYRAFLVVCQARVA